MSKVNANSPIPPPSASLPVINPFAAGIDVGDTEMVVAVCPSLTSPSVRTFGTMTADLHELLQWLQACKVQTVAMESTGVYWKCLFNLLSSHDLEILLVNARHVKNVTGRKTDQSDAMWIQQLHSCGLLSSSYLPDDQQDALRTLVRHRRTLLRDCNRVVNRMQKALELMNIKFHTIISDITGKSGRAVIEAILAGEREPANFLPLIHKRVQADTDKIVKSLEGNWRSEQLYVLKDCYEMYGIYQHRLAGCDEQIQDKLQRYEDMHKTQAVQQQQGASDAPLAQAVKTGTKPAKRRKQKNQPRFEVSTYLQAILGVDVLDIYGLSEITAMEILAETGVDMSKWPTQNHFVSWLNLCPNNKISGGKLISSKVASKRAGLASQAFRLAANGVQRSQHYLGEYFRRMKAKGGNKYAVIATGAKIARIYYKMVRYKQPFNPVDMQQYQSQYRQAKIASLQRRLAQLKNEVA